MTRIGNVDHVLLLLREQLARTDRKRSSGRASVEKGESASTRPMARVRALATLERFDEPELQRAVVRGLLTEEFGDGIGNDASLNMIVDDVMRIIAEMPGGPQLMARAIAQLREEMP